MVGRLAQGLLVVLAAWGFAAARPAAAAPDPPALSAGRDAPGALPDGRLRTAANRLVFGGACKVCPWGVVAQWVQAALAPEGYDVQVCYNCSATDAPRIVAEAREPPPWRPGSFPGVSDADLPPPPHGPVDFGATSVQFLSWAYAGSHTYAAETPRRHLRLLATVQAPSYLIVAVKSSLGITDLAQLRSRRGPWRVLVDVSDVPMTVLAYYGLSKSKIEEAGGHVGRAIDPGERTDFDVIIHGGALANAPESNVWYEVSQRFDLTYLQLPDDLLDKLARDDDMERRDIPNGLLRGVHRAIPTVARTGIAIYGRDDMPDEVAYAVAKALDDQQGMLQWLALPISYNRHTVTKAAEVPLHPGAARYYRDRGYLEREAR